MTLNRKSNSFSPFLNIMPADAIRTPLPEVVKKLEQRFGEPFSKAIDNQHFTPSPTASEPSTDWIKTANCVGVNVRTIGNFWNLVPYAMTLPAAQNAIHILPVWEPGVVASLYGPASWNVSPEFYSPEMHAYFPHLDSIEKQLKVVVNILHLLGKAVGMDVVPHTDRFSEQVLANPQHFEWLRRDGLKIVDHRSNLHEMAQEIVMEFLKYRGSAIQGLNFPTEKTAFFSQNELETARLRVLFGEKSDYGGRLARRKELIKIFYQYGLETVPATMGPPYRGLEIDPDVKFVDEDGMVWQDFKISRPEKFSRVFGPLTRFKLWESKDDNQNWELDFSIPRPETWDYVCKNYHAVQAEFGFDFMRGDMSHVQMRPGGVPANARQDEFYDLLGAVKTRVLAEKPSFGYFAESFLAPPGEMAFGDELEHLEASFADSTLGDLQSEPTDTQHFAQQFANYREWLETRKVAPNFTVMTADKDDPRFDKFYLAGNEARFFLSIFLTDMPSYMGLNFECRDPHPKPAPNEHYTKLYVFQEKTGPKATSGPFVFGGNRKLYFNICKIKQFAEAVFSEIEGAKVQWLVPPDASGEQKVLAWTQAEKPDFIFVVNLDTKQPVKKLAIELPKQCAGDGFKLVFAVGDAPFFKNEKGKIILETVSPGQCLSFLRTDNF